MINRILNYIHSPKINWFKTLFINFYKLDFKIAIKLPIYIYEGVHFKDLSGEIRVYNAVRGGIRIGLRNDAPSIHGVPTYINLIGTIHFNRYCQIGEGNFINVYNPKAVLYIHENVRINNCNIIACGTRISLGEQVLIASNVQIHSTESHYLIRGEKIHTGYGDEVAIGRNTWIGNNCTILKNTYLGDDCIVASNTVCTASTSSNDGCLLAGNPAKVISQNEVRLLRNLEDEGYIWDAFCKGVDNVYVDELPKSATGLLYQTAY